MSKTVDIFKVAVRCFLRTLCFISSAFAADPKQVWQALERDGYCELQEVPITQKQFESVYEASARFWADYKQDPDLRAFTITLNKNFAQDKRYITGITSSGGPSFQSNQIRYNRHYLDYISTKWPDALEKWPSLKNLYAILGELYDKTQMYMSKQLSHLAEHEPSLINFFYRGAPRLNLSIRLVNGIEPISAHLDTSGMGLLLHTDELSHTDSFRLAAPGQHCDAIAYKKIDRKWPNSAILFAGAALEESGYKIQTPAISFIEAKKARNYVMVSAHVSQAPYGAQEIHLSQEHHSLGRLPCTRGYYLEPSDGTAEPDRYLRFYWEEEHSN